MKKNNLLNRAEMKKILGGVHAGSTCSESEYYVSCSRNFTYLESCAPGPGSFECGNENGTTMTYVGCMNKWEYETYNKPYCTILGNGGPYPTGPGTPSEE